MNGILKRSITEHAHALLKKEYSSEELTKAFLDRIDSENQELNAYITVTHYHALREARASDARRKDNATLSILDGIPYAVKDNIAVKGIRLTCGSKMLRNYVSPYDSTVTTILHESGAVLLGKTNLDEFAMGTGTETAYFGRTKNPLDLERVPGGSSGGSSAALAADLAVFALGSDTGGSVRQPAAFCGVVGFRPTYSVLSRKGLVGFAPSLDTVGIMTRTVEDCKIIFESTAKKDVLDFTSSSYPMPDFSALADNGIYGKKIAVVREIAEYKISEEERNAIEKTVNLFKSLGADVIEVSIPSIRSCYAAYYVISSAQASSNLARFDGVRFGFRADNASTVDELYTMSRSLGFGEEVKRRILFGTLALNGSFKSDIYDDALKTQAIIASEFAEALNLADIVILPTSSDCAYKAGEHKNHLFDAHIEDDIFCTPASLCGLPAISVPYKNICGLPLGVQLVGNRFGEKILFEAAHLLQEALKTKSKSESK